jgi:hypothetical protein
MAILDRDSVPEKVKRPDKGRWEWLAWVVDPKRKRYEGYRQLRSFGAKAFAQVIAVIVAPRNKPEDILEDRRKSPPRDGIGEIRPAHDE